MARLFIVCRNGEMLNALQEATGTLTNSPELIVFHSAADALCHLAEAKQPDCDMAIINAPLPDEFGNELAKVLYEKYNLPSVLLTPAEHVQTVEEYLDGISSFVIAKPISKNALMQSIQLASGAFRRINRLSTENEALQKKFEDFKVIDRAKCTLVGVLKMNEQQAHRYIQKQAMDQRVKPRVIADSILKTYEF